VRQASSSFYPLPVSKPLCPSVPRSTVWFRCAALHSGAEIPRSEPVPPGSRAHTHHSRRGSGALRLLLWVSTYAGILGLRIRRGASGPAAHKRQLPKCDLPGAFVRPSRVPIFGQIGGSGRYSIPYTCIWLARSWRNSSALLWRAPLSCHDFA